MRVIERVWEWHFAASPEALWPVLADTARFNEAVGLPRSAVSETLLPDGSVKRVGSARVFADDRVGGERPRMGRAAPFRASAVKGFPEPIALRRIPPPADVLRRRAMHSQLKVGPPESASLNLQEISSKSLAHRFYRMG